MCGGGGGGGGDAERIEQQRRERIAQATAAINDVFSHQRRNRLYSQHRDNVYERNMQEYNRQAEQARRQMEFELARRGLAGGQAEIDSLAQLNENLSNAKLKVADFADQAGNQLRTSDEDARLRLISQAQTGMDANVAAQNAMNQLKVNSENASSYNELASLGDLFSGIGLMQNQVNTNAAKAAARKQYGQDGYNTIYGQGAGGGFGGTTTKIGQ